MPDDQMQKLFMAAFYGAIAKAVSIPPEIAGWVASREFVPKRESCPGWFWNSPKNL
jgi:hypothetical protein